VESEQLEQLATRAHFVFRDGALPVIGHGSPGLFCAKLGGWQRVKRRSVVALAQVWELISRAK
jgi:hypothetical protein